MKREERLRATQSPSKKQQLQKSERIVFFYDHILVEEKEKNEKKKKLKMKVPRDGVEKAARFLDVRTKWRRGRAAKARDRRRRGTIGNASGGGE